MSATSPTLPVRRVWVTGVSSGLGAAFARRLLAEGVDVWGTARSLERLHPWASEARFHPVVLDLERPEAVAVFARAWEDAGGFDCVINNAGYGCFGPWAEVAWQEWESQLEAMVVRTAALTQEAWRRFQSQGHGTLVNVSSLATEFPLPYMAVYNMAKAALSALSESLMFEARGSALSVIDFRPGDFRTEFNRALRGVATPPQEEPLRTPWLALEQNLSRGPEPEVAAHALWRALLAKRSGIVRTGGWFQAVFAPRAVRLISARMKRWLTALYFRRT